MFWFGGSLNRHPIFQKILSIGFEFESGNLIKLSSVHNSESGDVKLVNSDISIKSLEGLMLNDKARKIGNYIEVDYEDGKKMMEYFYENEDEDSEVEKKIKIHITNDLSEGDFVQLLRSKCKKLEDLKKEDLYTIKTTDKTYKMEIMSDKGLCEQISNVEYVITYYNPELEKNIILKQYRHASNIIIEHLRNLVSENCDLLIHSPQFKKKVRVIKSDLSLFHKPESTLYYMSSDRIKSYLDITLTPQMTFKCDAKDLISIVKQIAKNEMTNRDPIHTNYDEMEGTYNLLITIEEITTIILKSAEIDVQDEIGQRLSCYLFMILYKLFSFINHHEEFGEDSYLKDRLSFSSRHHNIDLYYRLQDLLSEYYPSVTAYSLFENSAISELYLNPIVTKTTDFGNPLHSIISYVEYLEDRNSDWLVDNGYDVFSTTFSLENDEVLIENRSFFKEIMLHMYNLGLVDKDENKTFLTIGEMMKFTKINQKSIRTPVRKTKKIHKIFSDGKKSRSLGKKSRSLGKNSRSLGKNSRSLGKD